MLPEFYFCFDICLLTHLLQTDFARLNNCVADGVFCSGIIETSLCSSVFVAGPVYIVVEHSLQQRAKSQQSEYCVHSIKTNLLPSAFVMEICTGASKPWMVVKLLVFFFNFLPFYIYIQNRHKISSCQVFVGWGYFTVTCFAFMSTIAPINDTIFPLSSSIMSPAP